jgi:hypothetical protein
MRRHGIPALFAALVAALIVLGGAGEAQAATSCPGTFTVLHNDRVGTMAVPGGAYAVRTNGVSCANASQLIGRFLDDFDGVLPGGWTTAASGVGFVNGSTGSSITMRAAKPPTPPPAGRTVRCPGTFQVQHNDRIGALRLPAGPYVIQVRRLSCAAASQQFATFLFQDYSGRLPQGWKLNVAARRFSNGRALFTVTRASNKPSGGGGVHPNHAITCPGTVSLASGTTLGSLVLPAGRYYVNVFSNLPCRAATRDFERFAAAGAVPVQWTIEPQTGVFLRGREGFQIEPVR